MNSDSKQGLIEIESGEIEVRSGTNAKGPWEIRTQEGYIYNGHSHPERVLLPLPRNHAGYQPGLYSLAPECFAVGDFRSLTLSRSIVLRPHRSAVAAVAAAK